MANFPILSPDQASPGLWASRNINDIYKRMLENQYYGRNIESEILNRNQHSRLLGEQAQWYGPKSQAEIDLINKGHIPHYRAQSGLLGQQAIGQGLTNQYEREIMPYKVGAAEYLPEEARNHAFLTGQQGLEAGSRSRKESAEAQKLSEIINYIHDVYGDTNNPTQQSPTPSQPYQNNGDYNANAPTPSLNAEQERRINENFNKSFSGMPGQIDPSQLAQIDKNTPQQPIQRLQEAQDQTQRQTPIQTEAPLSKEEKMMRLADILATFKGETPPSLEPVLRAREETAKLNAKAFHEINSKYVQDSIGSTTALQNLQELETAMDKLPNSATNTWMPESIKKIIGGKEAQVALKAGANLMLGELKPMFSGLGQVRVAELNMLASGTPNINMTKGAAKEVIGQIRTALEVKRTQGQMAQKLKSYTNDPNDLQATMAMAARNLNPVDETGIHPERLKDWMKYATPEAVKAARNGDNYIPQGISLKSLHPDALRQLRNEAQ